MTVPTQPQDAPGVDELAALVAAQARTIDDLRARLETLEDRTSAAIPEGTDGDDVASPSGSGEVRTGRRQLLSMAGMAAAGAVAGTTVLVSQATPAAAASGTFDGTPAVTATSPTRAVVATTTDSGGQAVRALANSTDSWAVYGAAVAGTSATVGVFGDTYSVSGCGTRGWARTASGTTCGVEGISDSEVGTGVQGFHNKGTGAGVGVKGVSYSPAGVGVRAEAATGVEVRSSREHLKLTQLNSVWPAPPLGAGLPRTAGELVFDGSRWWLCVVSGTPGEWRLVAGPTTAGSLNLLDAAVRAYDSRAGFPPTTVEKGKLAQNQERAISLTVGGGVPEGARAALINLTVTNTSAGGGFLKLYMPGSQVPTASAINWSSGGQNIANSATVAINHVGDLSVRCGGAGASTDFIVDVSGYYL